MWATVPTTLTKLVSTFSNTEVWTQGLATKQAHYHCVISPVSSVSSFPIYSVTPDISLSNKLSTVVALFIITCLVFICLDALISCLSVMFTVHSASDFTCFLKSGVQFWFWILAWDLPWLQNHGSPFQWYHVWYGLQFPLYMPSFKRPPTLKSSLG